MVVIEVFNEHLALWIFNKHSNLLSPSKELGERDLNNIFSICYNTWKSCYEWEQTILRFSEVIDVKDK